MNKGKYIIGFSLIQLFVIAAIIVHFFDPALFSSDSTRFNDTLLISSLFNDCTVIPMKSEITAYCPGPCCNSSTFTKNGKRYTVDWTNRVAAGNIAITDLHQNGIQIVAVDSSTIPHGSIVSYNGTRYLAIDSGSAIIGTRLDISMANHESTQSFGRRYDQDIIVHIPKNPDAVLEAVTRYIEGKNIAANR
ncbi:MAG TPA: 3D domain-containing protein [Spirochaetota bacterium]|nr:3D domain-containing protein [Spirochaetota bacterium]